MSNASTTINDLLATQTRNASIHLQQVDELACIRHLNEAAYMAAGDRGLGKSANNALQSLLGIIIDKIGAMEADMEDRMEALNAD